jgi:hypothetical protein
MVLRRTQLTMRQVQSDFDGSNFFDF